MASIPKTIGNPLSWAVGAAVGTGEAIGEAASALGSDCHQTPITQPISIADLADSLRLGYEDFSALRSDVIFLVLMYPVIGICLAVLAFDNSLIPMFFPLAAGFALLGPLAAVGLYEMSRQRETGRNVTWGATLSVLRAGSIGPVLILGAYLFGIFLTWIVAAYAIFQSTLGPEQPASVTSFLSDVFTTAAGWEMIVIGTGVGFIFAAVVLVISVVSFPMLIDRRIGLPVAVHTSVQLARENPVTIAAWGLIVSVGLLLGSIPLFLGLIVVLPILGHATWHLYRKAVVFRPTS